MAATWMLKMPLTIHPSLRPVTYKSLMLIYCYPFHTLHSVLCAIVWCPSVRPSVTRQFCVEFLAT